MIQSMTAFASRAGTHGPECWAWEMRGVNARGLKANTLCAKAGAPALTRIGLDLKATIDQMREQIQNVE